MKVIFLCGSLQPGCDGVGDYSRRLAGALISQGNQVEIIALKDREIEVAETSLQFSDGVAVSVLRLPAKMDSRTRLIKVADFIEAFKPDWLSLQYVPFAFQQNGLHFGLTRQLAKIGKGIRWHIMFHELWIGRNKDTSLKDRAISFLQQMQIKRLVNILRPSLVHTHLPLYQLRLNSLKIPAAPLPLFSNISVAQTIDKEKASYTFRMAFFSQVDTFKSVIDFINQFSILAKQKGLSPELLLIGGSENKMIKMVDFFQKACPQLVRVSHTGFLNAAEISKVIGSCDLGLTPIPVHALGKSGSAAAFFAHSIPLAAPVEDEAYSQAPHGFFSKGENDSILIKPVWEKFEAAKIAVVMVPTEIHVTAISKLFYLDLTGPRN